MKKTFYIIQDNISGNYLLEGFKSLTNNEALAVRYDSKDNANEALLRSSLKGDLNILRVTFNTELTLVYSVNRAELVLERSSHLDATHVGLKGNAFFYFCDEENGKDYCYDETERVWNLCDWTDHEDSVSEYDKLIPINFGVSV